MPASQPRPEQIEALAKNHPEGDLYMLNPLKLRERAVYADGRETDLTGQQAYMIYGAEVQKIIEGFGGGLLFGGAANVLVIGDGGFAMTMGELETVVREDLPLVIVLMNDCAYGAEVHFLRMADYQHQENKCSWPRRSKPTVHLY